MDHIGDLLHEEYGPLAPARIRRADQGRAKILELRPPARNELTWVCVAGERGKYWNLDVEYQGCGVVSPLETRPGHFVRRSCRCEKTRLEEHKQAVAKAEFERTEIYNTFQIWGGASLANKTFDNFIRERQAGAYDVCVAFAEMLVGTLILYGGFGLGKTHLLAAICNALRAMGISSTFVTSPKFFGVIQERLALRESIAPIISRTTTTPLLVFDDADKAKWSEWREELYFQIIDERTKQGLPTAFSVNRLDALPDLVGGAVASRLSIGQIAIELTGKDYRPNL